MCVAQYLYIDLFIRRSFVDHYQRRTERYCTKCSEFSWFNWQL